MGRSDGVLSVQCTVQKVLALRGHSLNTKLRINQSFNFSINFIFLHDKTKKLKTSIQSLKGMSGDLGEERGGGYWVKTRCSFIIIHFKSPVLTGKLQYSEKLTR